MKPKYIPDFSVKKERDVEAYLRDRIKKLGGVAYKFVSPAHRSVPDRMVLLPGGRIYFVEVKTDRGKLTEGQRRELERLQLLGFETRVLFGMDGVQMFINEVEIDGL